jgi:hypothetical protein
MLNLKKLLVIFLIIFLASPADAFLFSKKEEKNLPDTQFDNSKTNEEMEEDLPDLMEPLPDTPEVIKLRKQEEKKTAKEQKKQMKHSKKKVDEISYPNPKKVKKYNFELVERENKAPKTWAEYLDMSKDVKREDMQIPSHNFEKDDKLLKVIEPGIRIVKYNSPPGPKDLDLRLLMSRHELVTPAVLSPDKRKLVYSTVYSLPTTEQVASEMFYIEIPENTDIKSALTEFHTIEAVRTPILKAGSDHLFQYEKRTLTLIDWSEDGQKIVVAEKIGAQTKGPWETHIWTYDFELKKAYELTALREAIRYYWYNKDKLDLSDYMWDLYPIGWDKYNKDRIIVFAYAYGEGHKGSKFLGAWSIDYKNQRTELMSEKSTDYEVSANGYCLKLTIGRDF